MSDNYYDVLGLRKNASNKDIKKAYHKLALKWHPDKHANKSDDKKKEAENKFKEINEAYEILGNPEKRKKYDIHGKRFFSENESGYQFHNANDIFRQVFEEFSFNGMPKTSFPFGGIHGMPGQGIRINVGRNRSSDDMFQENHDTAYRKDDPIMLDINLTLEELCYGAKKKRKISRKIYSYGSMRDEEEIINIDVKPGWKEGTKITFAKKGDVKPGIEPADIIFTVKEVKHDRFTRDDNNLITNVDITLDQALHGINVNVKCLNGQLAKIKLPNGITTSAYVHKISRMGMPVRKGGRIIDYGDLLVEFTIKLKD